MDGVSVLTLISIGLVAVFFYQQRRNFVISKLRGPPSASWLLGHDFEMRNQAEVGDLDFAWLTQKWKDQIQAKDSKFNVSRWLARATLDAIGEAAFDFNFEAIDNGNGELTKSFDNLFADSVLHPPRWDVLFKALWRYIPTPILQLVEYIPTKEYRRFKNFKKLVKRVAKELIDEKAHIEVPAETSRDVMSVLVKANVSEDPKRQLDEDEILSQMAHPEDQKELRDEIRQLRQTLPLGAEFTIANFESLTFTNAVLKEILRIHPIVPALVRTAAFDDVLPLSIPIVTKGGDIVTEIPVKKGTDIVVSICAYNRLPEVWGPDADQWNPRRFLEKPTDKQTSVGVFANLMTFSAGIRGCIGWRFALIELQALLVEMIENFEFSLPRDVEIMRLPAGIMIPMVKGRMHEGTQMPLNLTLVEEQ
ncbi:hypothetical protein ONZ45_g1869 [Pleurotus djamor]|nr:hypothetical protein ONZ45_g1869 [Pleurotus djamor]